MDRDVFEGKWKQIKGEAKAWWGRLTDNDLDQADGKFDVLTGLLQEKYGYTRQRAIEEIDQRITEYEAGRMAKPGPAPSGDWRNSILPSLLRKEHDVKKYTRVSVQTIHSQRRSS